MKIQNVLSAEPEPHRAGLSVSRMDRYVWENYSDRPDEVRRLAALIRSGQDLPAPDLGIEDVELDGVIAEGGVVMRMHKRRERSPEIRKKALARVRKGNGGELRCEGCGAGAAVAEPRSVEESAFEAHHLRPLADPGERLTSAKDAVLLSATCHRMIHSLARVEGEWLPLRGFRKRIGKSEA
ncbi:MAG: hypothetical protein H6807_08555 [Planctomycetes bacterium]|nr:hypothetical protein [Polyangiaceae bacterium]MCB9832513.1 hypothetical protein [Planctomycetota bacterium]